MTIQSLLSNKKSEIKTIGPKIRIETAAALLHENRIGAFPVVDADGKLVGLLSERDIIRVVAQNGSAGLLKTVEDVMTRDVVTLTPQASVKEVMRTMSERRFRHLPIVENGAVKAMISIGDVLKSRLDAAELEMNVLRDVAIARV